MGWLASVLSGGIRCAGIGAAMPLLVGCSADSYDPCGPVPCAASASICGNPQNFCHVAPGTTVFSVSSLDLTSTHQLEIGSTGSMPSPGKAKVELDGIPGRAQKSTIPGHENDWFFFFSSFPAHPKRLSYTTDTTGKGSAGEELYPFIFVDEPCLAQYIKAACRE